MTQRSGTALRFRKWWVETYFVAWYTLGWALIGVLFGLAIGVSFL